MRGRCAIAVGLAAGLLAACGGDGGSETQPPGSPSNPLVALPNPTGTRTPPTAELPGESAQKASGRRADESATTTAARSTKSQSAAAKPAMTRGGADGGRASAGSRKQRSASPSAARPCSLVTKAKASAILDAALVEPIQAPQGPTCIYQAASGKTYVTLSVQSIRFEAMRRQIGGLRRVDVGSRSAYCGTLGRSMLYLPLSSGRVLGVAAPCSIATRFAREAAPHL